MPSRHEISEYFTITELTREFGVSTRTIRFYEDEGLINPVRRGRTRLFRPSDRRLLSFILRGKRLGFSIAEIRDILDLYEEKGEAVQSAQALRVFRQRIEQLEAQRQEVEDAILTLKAAAGRLARQHPDAAKLVEA
jgi:DNA-binding transcriptional MerR regulator